MRFTSLLIQGVLLFLLFMRDGMWLSVSCSILSLKVVHSVSTLSPCLWLLLMVSVRVFSPSLSPVQSALAKL